MTTFKFFLDDNKNVVGFVVKDHSGYAESGSDIVCSAISSCVGMLEMGMVKLLGKVRGSFSVNYESVVISFMLPHTISDSEKSQALLLTNMLMDYVRNLQKSYKEHIKIEKRRV